MILEYELGSPKITKDGVTVAKNIMFGNRPQELGSQLVRSVCHDTNLFAGDGTTTATILATAIIEEGLKYQSDKTINVTDLKKGLIKCKE